MKLCARVITLFVLIALTACISPNTTETPSNYVVDSEAALYVESFVREAKAYNVNLPDLPNLHVLFVPSFSSSTFVATCTPHYQRPTIHISEEHWSSKSENEKEVIMFHELGHCLLHRSHNETVVNSVPTSLMFPIQLSDAVYEPRRAAYIHELFSQ